MRASEKENNECGNGRAVKSRGCVVTAGREEELAQLAGRESSRYHVCREEDQVQLHIAHVASYTHQEIEIEIERECWDESYDEVARFSFLHFRCWLRKIRL